MKDGCQLWRSKVQSCFNTTIFVQSQMDFNIVELIDYVTTRQFSCFLIVMKIKIWPLLTSLTIKICWCQQRIVNNRFDICWLKRDIKKHFLNKICIEWLMFSFKRFGSRFISEDWRIYIWLRILSYRRIKFNDQFSDYEHIPLSMNLWIEISDP